MAILHSYSNKPWELYLKKTKANAEAKQLTEGQSEAFSNYEWREPELIEFLEQNLRKLLCYLMFPFPYERISFVFLIFFSIVQLEIWTQYKQKHCIFKAVQKGISKLLFCLEIYFLNLIFSFVFLNLLFQVILFLLISLILQSAMETQ